MRTQSTFSNAMVQRNALQQTIEQLKSQMLFKQTEFIKKKQTYEQIISNLQQQNNRLKQLITLTESAIGTQQKNSKKSKSNHPQQSYTGIRLSKKGVQSQKQLENKDRDFLHECQKIEEQDLNVAKNRNNGKQQKVINNNENYFTLGNSKRNQYIYVYEDYQSLQEIHGQFGSRQVRGMNNDQLPSFSECSRVEDDSYIPQLKIPEYNYQQLLRQNEILKEEITNLTNTYQRQLEQLAFYFQKIKLKQEDITNRNNSFDGSQKVSKAHYEGQIKLIFDSYQATVKDFGKERQKYRLKILQMDKFIQFSVAKVQELQFKVFQLQNQLKISQESIKALLKLS